MKNFAQIAVSLALVLSAMQEARAGVGSLAVGYALGSSQSGAAQEKAQATDNKPSRACFIQVQALPGAQALINLAHVKTFDFTKGTIIFDSGSKLNVKPFTSPRDPAQYRQPGQPSSSISWDDAMACDSAAQPTSLIAFTFGSNRVALRPSDISAIVVAGQRHPKPSINDLQSFQALVMLREGNSMEFETLAGVPSFNAWSQQGQRDSWFAKRQEAGAKASDEMLRTIYGQLSQAGATWKAPQPLEQPKQAKAAKPK